ncbi:MAG TPA: hypothetical protein VGD90_01230 [Sphingobacteriaceae bacterium]
MRKRYFLPIFLFLFTTANAQDISGKWYGRITQLPGAYSELYELELDLKQDRNKISGESFATIKDTLYIRIGLTGSLDADSIRLQENLQEVRQEVLPYGWLMCVKNIQVGLTRLGTKEYLEGHWNGIGRDLEACLPGRIILARNKEDLNFYLANHRNAPPQITPVSQIIPPPQDFSIPFLNTEARKVTEIEVSNRTLQLRVRDYRKIDNDTISVYLNREALVRNVRIARKMITVDFELESGKELHELLLYAENLGRIPPNTSQLMLVDGEKTHRIMIESDKQKSAAIYLRFKP